MEQTVGVLRGCFLLVVPTAPYATDDAKTAKRHPDTLGSGAESFGVAGAFRIVTVVVSNSGKEVTLFTQTYVQLFAFATASLYEACCYDATDGDVRRIKICLNF